MSIEHDLEAFRELALEEQIRLPYYQKQYGELGYVFHQLDPLLEDILPDNPLVTVVGDLLISGFDEGERYTHVMPTGCENRQVSGYCVGVDIVDRSSLQPEVKPGNLVIGFCVEIVCDSSVNFDIEEQVYAFAPVESSTMIAPALIVPKEQLLPEPDDEVAQVIDVCMLADTIDLMKLGKLFYDLDAENVTDLHIDYYLHYLNALMPLNEYEISLTTDRVVSRKAVGGYEVSEPEDNVLWRIETSPTRFNYDPVYGLSIVLDIYREEHDNFCEVIYPLQNVYELTYAIKQEDNSHNGYGFASESMN